MPFTKEYLKAVRIKLEKRGKREEEIEDYLSELIDGGIVDKNDHGSDDQDKLSTDDLDLLF